ncbi:hypothetical protein DNTS_022828 [Danionella cerebrum]|uniref:RRM domain-containing protein n=1 Tax=Danionella cerebrum TaxID=2873325 RepID=A0A553RAS0_9TELE|nr:hypothetical protein DNTS_022828 [Danionella translucida]
MSGDSSGNKEFHEQLRLQQLYGQKEEGGDDPYTYTDPEDGTVYDWDHDKRAWFPKINDDFIAAYQANYGFNEEGAPDPSAGIPSTVSVPEKPTEPKKQEEPKETVEAPEQVKNKEAAKKGEKRKADSTWFDVEKDKNTNVYVTEEYKIKIYKDKDGNQKGDGLCCYLKKESVALAKQLLDEYEIRGYQMHVEEAQFELKGQYDASKKKKKNKEYRKKLQQQQKQLDWRPEKSQDARKRHEKVVIIKNMFHPSDFEARVNLNANPCNTEHFVYSAALWEDPLELNEYREDLRTECEKFGQVKKVIIFDRHPDGVASVAFKEAEEADKCQVALNGRWFGGRQLSAELWDGVTDYQVEETSREREERLKGWSSFLGDEKATGDTKADSSKPNAELNCSTQETAEQCQQEEKESTSKPLQKKHEEEEEMASTDSSLAGSDEEDS